MAKMTCTSCGRTDPPRTQSCHEGLDHVFRKGPGVCPNCFRLLEVCRKRPCSAMEKVLGIR